MLPQVLKHLTVPRPVNANRAEFFPQAEAFACLVSLGSVGVQGRFNLSIISLNNTILWPGRVQVC